MHIPLTPDANLLMSVEDRRKVENICRLTQQALPPGRCSGRAHGRFHPCSVINVSFAHVMVDDSMNR